MKGLELSINSKKVSGAISRGITGVIITQEDNKYRIYFSSTDETGMISYQWYAEDFFENDNILVSLKKIIESSEPQAILDHNKQDEIDRLALQDYYRLKEELIRDGLIEDDQDIT